LKQDRDTDAKPICKIQKKRKPLYLKQTKTAQIRPLCLGLWAQTFRPADFFNTNQYKIISISMLGARNKIAAELSMLRVQGVCVPNQGDCELKASEIIIQIQFFNLNLKRNDDDSTKFEYYF